MNTINLKLNDRAGLTIYLQKESEELKIRKRPMVLVFPGGGYSMVSDRESECIAFKYFAAGFNTAILNYTVKLNYKMALEDAEACMKYLSEKKEELNCNKLIVVGFSAGGHLALSTGSILKENRPDAMVLVYAAYDQRLWNKTFPDPVDLLPYMDENTPKCFLAHSSDDSTVPIISSLKIMEKLDEYKIPFECHIYKSGDHGFGPCTEEVAGWRPGVYDGLRNKNWVNDSISFIKEAVGNIEY